MAYLKALLIGEVKIYGDKNATEPLNKIWKTAMFKTAQTGEIWADKLGFKGDNVADTKQHGGEEKAIFANSYENYTHWEQFLGFKNLPFGAMGENLTISGLDENSVCVGDIHEIGSLVLQVSQPRKPCFKLSKRWMNTSLAREIFRTGRTGWYYRVVENGSCKAGDIVKIVAKDEIGMSIFELNSLFYDPKSNLNLISKFNRLKSIPKGWNDDIQRRIAGLYDTTYMDEL